VRRVLRGAAGFPAGISVIATSNKDSEIAHIDWPSSPTRAI
jgi:hypothetical protein